MLIADEVICGFGRTGGWLGSDYYAIEPDLMPIAKYLYKKGAITGINQRTHWLKSGLNYQTHES